MPDADAFLQAIAAAPDDDTPRLVYADWLDENGDAEGRAHAALIRGQCELERLPPDDRARKPLEQAARQVLQEYADRWSEPLLGVKPLKSWEFRRGFVERITIPAREFVRVAEKLFSLAPLIRSATFPEASNEVTALTESPYLARLREVNLNRMCECGHCRIEEELPRLFRSKHAANLTALSMAGDRIDTDGAARLARSAPLAKLERLDLSDNPVGPAGVAAVANSRRLTRLRSLDLSRTGLTTAGVKALAAGSAVSGLTALGLRGNRLGPAAVRAVLAAPFAPGLEELDWADNRLGDSGAEVLSLDAAAVLVKLRRLDVRRNAIGPDAGRALKARFGKRVRV